VTFTGAGQPTGSDNAIVDYQWDLDGDGIYEIDTLGTPSVSRSYPVPATIKVRLQVTDSFGNLGFAPVQFLTIGDRPPVPSFGFAPGTPFTGETVNFFSTSSDPDSAIVEQSWDLDGDGNFGDATGPSVTRSFASPGSYTVSLQVRDAEGSIQTTTQTVVVSAPPQVKQSSPRVSLLSPFPIVRISGAIKRRGTKLRRFSVTAPIGSTVTVRCKGRGCPFRRQTRTARAPAKRGTAATRLIRIRPLERRLLRAGIVVKVFVTKPGTIGKFTQFKMKKQRPPARIDKCLTASGSTPVECPVS
jgi:hypothetical protein